MHMLKVKLSAAHGMLVYDAREPGDWVNPETHGETLYPDQTKRNYALLDVHQKVAPHEALRVSQSRLETAVETHKSTKGRPPRKDAVGLAQWCVTLPREVPREDAEEFFRFTLHLFQQRYGADNVPAGFVHMDETTPHMHVPVVMLKDNSFQAKNIVNRDDLRTIHSDFEAQAQEISLGYRYLLDEEDRIGKLMSNLTRDELNTLEVALERKFRAKNAEIAVRESSLEKRESTLGEQSYALQQALSALKRDEEDLKEEQLRVTNAKRSLSEEKGKLERERLAFEEEKKHHAKQVRQRAEILTQGLAEGEEEMDAERRQRLEKEGYFG